MGKTVFKFVAVTIIIVCGAAAMVAFFGSLCPVLRLTGFPCPGCGMSRACVSVLKGDLISAFSYHPLFPLAPFFVCGIILYCVPTKMSRKLRKYVEYFLISVGGLFIVVWIIRLVLGWRG